MKRFVSWFFVFSVFGILIFATSCDSRPPIVVDLNPLDSIDHRRDSTGSGGSGGSGGSDSTTICFERDILPIFLSNCAMSGCHDAQSREGGYVLTSYETITAKGIVPYQPNKSEIYKVLIGQGGGTIGVSPWLVLRRDGDDDNDDDGDDDGDDGDDDDSGDDDSDDDSKRMPPPPYPPLPQEQIDLIYQWIAEGAQNTQCDSTGGSGGSGGSGCDTLNISYAQDIQPILATNCVGCHSSAAPSGGVVLDNYNSVKSVASSGRLYGAVAHLSGYKPMPPSGQLDNCSILKIKAWIHQGMPPLTFRFTHNPE